MSGLVARIEHIKANHSLLDILSALYPWLELPDGPGKIACILPDHAEDTPSCQIHEDRWYCFGCHRKGDALDMIQALDGCTLAEALERAEEALGIAQEGLGRLLGLAAHKLSPEARKASWERARWCSRVDRVEQDFNRIALYYLRAPDQDFHEIARSLCFALYDDLTRASMEGPSITPLADRGRAKRLRRQADAVLAELRRQARERLGWDDFDAALSWQAREHARHVQSARRLGESLRHAPRHAVVALATALILSLARSPRLSTETLMWLHGRLLQES